jgi:hypothetical protein
MDEPCGLDLEYYAMQSEISRLTAENARMRELIHDLLRLPTAPAFDCFHCKYEEHDDCDYGRRCKLVERARDLGIGVTP